MAKATLLLVEAEDGALAAAAAVAEDQGYTTIRVHSLAQARRALVETDPSLVLTEVELEDGRAGDLLEEVADDVEVVIVTDTPSLDSAVAALRLGAADYLTKPIDRERLRAIFTRFHRTSELREELSSLREELRGAGRFGPMLGASEAMKEIFALIERVARTEATVFITGESGTGKELVAETVHAMSRRRNRPLLPLNCGAVAPTLIESELFGHEKGAFTGADKRRQGYFERAHGGTLFLDEITEMPIELQVKLLRVLESGKVRRVGGVDSVDVDVRVLAASNRDPEDAVADGSLREDLYYRLRVFPIHLPPLRERGDDIELLARHFLSELNAREETRKRWTDDAVDCLLEYSWPGNVRELRNAVERACILADDRLTPGTLPKEVRMGLEGPVPASGPSLEIRVGTSIAEAEKRLILATLEENEGRRKETAEMLGISPKTLYNRLKAYEC